MINGLVHQSKSQTVSVDVHQLPETTVATAGIALAHENARMEGENGAGLEIAAIGTAEMEIEMGVGPRTEREAPVGSAITIDEVGNAPKNVKFRERSRSRSPHRNGTKARSPPRGPRSDRQGDRRDPRSRDDGRKGGAESEPERHEDAMDIDFNEDADEDEMDAQIRKALGFSRFRTTKNTKIPGNQIYAVRKEKKIEYRQYMNRQGGFNRPLSPSR
ncbi:hypothetical protein N7457_006622 [Penicillium paradoxum]|uniref:uncharacterized protein n=1 Tax=Penicillium paradoxum TaxID=176176 RepID=UPI0025491E49|nr:uncharacterized protein N7457_006622 [Penicillium paradoxum]KAJ5778902.1 hypothetical protein N7457_006622 [Penicillium paradoxum]